MTSSEAGELIRVRGLRKSFGDVTALDGVDLEVGRGEIFALLGPDGAGKTTLIRTLCGLLPPDEGEVVVTGHDVASFPESVKPHIGHLAQGFALYDDLTVRENVDFCARLFAVTGGAYDERLGHLLRMARLTPFQDRLAAHLSGGMRQKLALMCALVHRPTVLFLDEPTTGVDPTSRRDFWRLLSGLPSEGVTVFLSTPYMDEAERCDRVALLDRGRLLACATPSQLKAQVEGVLFDVVATPPQEARHSLEQLSAVRAVTVLGDRLHVAAAHGTSLAMLVSAMEPAGVEVESAEPVEPGLEDAFMAAIAKETRPVA